MNSEAKEENYVFDNVDTLVNFLFYQYKNLSPVKLQKGLYFLYAFYAGKYSDDKESNTFPKELFPAEFEAWTYGPVIKDVYVKYKDKEYEKSLSSFDIENELNNIPNGAEIKSFIESLFQKIQSVSDFELVDKAQSDVVWKEAFNSEDKMIKNENIWNEYKKKFK